MAASNMSRVRPCTRRHLALTPWEAPATARHSPSRHAHLRPRPPPPHSRPFTHSARRLRPDQQHRKESFRSRLRTALGGTKIEWKPIPIGLGVAFLGGLQFYRVRARETARRKDEEARRAASEDADARDREGRPKRRPRVRPSGPWSVQIMSTLPLKALSRLWGRFNELEIPYYLRVPGFRLYSWIFGVK